jgi:hypothetical protein
MKEKKKKREEEPKFFGTGPQFQFSGGRFFRFSDLEKMISTHSKDFCEENGSLCNEIVHLFRV